ncbi:hypothetical protein BY996DRAFT_2958407 [Phakopsora pachyrhizi]|nr:hypothetical protein BY996DRAFT_2958407 [Phakopsora pachyrhizi]
MNGDVICQSRVSISTSLIIIGALEKYGTLTKKKHELEDKIKNLLSISKPSKGEDSDGEKSKDQRRESEAEGRRTEELIRLERTRLKEEYQKNSRINKIAERSGDEERKRILKSIRLDSGGGDDEEGDDKKDSVVSTTSGCRGEVRKLVIDHCDGHHHHHELLRKAFLSDLPHDGKKIEEMTDDQRIERGAAVRHPSPFLSRGLFLY